MLLTNHKVPAGEQLPGEHTLIILRGKFRIARVLSHPVNADKRAKSFCVSCLQNIIGAQIPDRD